MLGHAGEDATAKTAKALGWKLTGAVKRCESCQVAKAKQKAVPKDSEHTPSKTPGERLYLDISSVKKPKEVKHVGKTNWYMIVDEATHLKSSNFYETKNGMVEPTCIFINKLHKNNIPTKFVRCDNAGETKAWKSLQMAASGN